LNILIKQCENIIGKMTLLFATLEEAQQKIPLNKTLKIVISGQSLCLMQTHEGFKAMPDECPHLGESLSKGTINYLNEIVCPWHSYRFNLKNGQEMTGKYCKDLKFYEIVIENNQVFLKL
jgi:3-phenylpropionate/trans-cinnamate dioxygenase ferredoxin subunit